MSTETFSVGPIAASQQRKAVTAISRDNTDAFTTDWQRFVDTEIVVAVCGSATALTAVVERSAQDPALVVNGVAQGAEASPADDTGFSGDLSAGIAPNIYAERGVGWWRVNASVVTGGTCTASLSGKG